MLSRPSVVRPARLALSRAAFPPTPKSRGFAAAASTSSTGSYETSDHGGIKVASRDGHAPTTTLAVVAKAGTRYQPLPGLTAGLEEFAFKVTETLAAMLVIHLELISATVQNTLKRSALRITRESELLGGQLTAYHTREALILEASFLRNDLPYFAELLGEVLSQTKYTCEDYTVL